MLDSTVVFNELMYNPETATEPEWVELYNQLAVDMDVSEWSLEGGIDYTFPAGTTVPGRGFLLVSATNTIPGAQAGVEILGPFTGALSNGGEEVRLINNDGRLMNTIDYSDGGRFWPVEPDGSGATLSKLNALTASEDFASWTASPQHGGTPGSANFESAGLGNNNPDSITVTLVPESQPVSVLVPSNGNLGDSWQDVGFNDSSWITGNAGVGYETSTGFEPHINLDVESIMDGVNESLYMRLEFDSPVSGGDIEDLTLQLKYDDGFIAYLNGTEVAQRNADDGNAWNAGASGTHNDGPAATFLPFDISKNELQTGTNVLAIHALNRGLGSSDFLISPKITYTQSLGGGTTTPGNIPLAINEVSPLAGNKFVEIANQGSVPINLNGLILRGTGSTGGDYVFPSQTLAVGARTVVTEAALGYAMEDNEKFFLYSSDQATIIDAQAITGRLRGLTSDGEWLYPDVATPAGVNSFDFNEDIVINEIMYHHQPILATATTPFADSSEEWIELYNRGDSTVDLTGWELRDGISFSFEAGTTIAPGEYLVVAAEPAVLAAEFPGIDIVGPFSGVLSNTSDRIELRDNFSNPADVLTYYESGQWDEVADGGGSSLELKDPNADNSIGSAWAASDETSKSTWNSYTNSKVSIDPLNIGTVFDELVFGLLEAGEVLIDNLSLTRSGSGVQHVANGNFENVAIGGDPANWRLIGNHENSFVIADPDDPSNRVLYLNAEGAQQYLHDHIEVSFANGQSIQDGQTYTISFDAKWLSGSRQLNNRLYFARAANTIVLDAPQDNGTPGAQNSQFSANIGPTYTDFAHAPLTPNANESVTVTVEADDPQGVSTMILYHNINGGNFSQVPMTLSNGVFTGTIPGRSSGQVVQFYVEGTDALGATSTYPQAGPESRALYEVNDGQSTSTPIESFRIVLTSEDNSHLFSSEDRMSNHYLRGTLIVGDHSVFYDAQIRQVGSRYIRPNSGYKVKFGSDERFYGVHESIRFDIDQLFNEVIMQQMVNRAAGSEVSMYDDISYMISPQHSGRLVQLNLARYESGYLKEQFGEDGTDGTKFELDDITYPRSANGPNNEKTGTGVRQTDMGYYGTDPEDYRGQLLIKNNRSLDDYETLVEFTRVINLSGTALENSLDDVMDVDLWMRHYATQSFIGNWDTYGFRRAKNLRLFIRPEDGKVIPLFWDADRGNFTEPLIYNGNQSRLDEIRNIPENERLFWGHMWDLTNRSFNAEYASTWIAHYSSLGVNTSSVNTINNRYNEARSEAQAAIPMVDFEIRTNNGNAITTDGTSVNLVGDGWIDVREIYVAGSPTPLEVNWTDDNSWEIIGLPVSPGQNTITLEARDFEGNPAGSDTISVTSTSVAEPLRDVLRISEINYHPTSPTSSELAATPGLLEDDFEFIEFTNTGSSNIDLTGVQIVSPISYTFPALSLAPGQRSLVVNECCWVCRTRYPSVSRLRARGPSANCPTRAVPSPSQIRAAARFRLSCMTMLITGHRWRTVEAAPFRSSTPMETTTIL